MQQPARRGPDPPGQPGADDRQAAGPARRRLDFQNNIQVNAEPGADNLMYVSYAENGNMTNQIIIKMPLIYCIFYFWT